VTDAAPSTTAKRPHLGHAALSLVTLAGGVTLAVIPAATVSIAARLFSVPEQGYLAVAVLLATFAGQLGSAIVVESRLSSAGTDRRVTFPRWFGLFAVLTALVLVFVPPNALILALGLPVMLAALEVGRGVSVAERLDRREIFASIAVGSGALAGVLAGFTGARWALVPLLAGIALATLIRCLPVPHRSSRAHPHVLGWVLADTAISGAVAPLINVVILAVLGAHNAVLFTALSTVSGLLAIPLNFMRLRLLKEHSRLDVVVSAASLCAAVAVLVALQLTGVFRCVFGEAWMSQPTLLPLLLACAWRAASLLTTLPFTALRRSGAVRLLTFLRAGVSAMTLGLAALGPWLSTATEIGGLSTVFAALLVAELASAGIYEAARRRHGSEPRRTPEQQPGSVAL